MDSYNETFNTWDNVASIYEDKFFNLKLYDKSYSAFCDLMAQDNAKILEIGCGPGNISKCLLNLRPEVSILGIDISPNMIELARKNNPKAEFNVMDGRSIVELNEVFHGIICGFYLPYISDIERQALIDKSKHLLADEGVLYLSFVDGDYQNSGYQTGSTGDRTYFYYHPLLDLRRELVASGLDIVYDECLKYLKKDGESELHTIIIARKTV